MCLPGVGESSFHNYRLDSKGTPSSLRRSSDVVVENGPSCLNGWTRDSTLTYSVKELYLDR